MTKLADGIQTFKHSSASGGIMKGLKTVYEKFFKNK